jgi:CHAT domain-containing protein
VQVFGDRSRLLVGADATERGLKSADLRPFGLIHLAAHAVVDEDQPERTAVILAADEAGEDGLLQAREVVDLDLGGRVVVLSACRTSGGAILGGEGAMSLARAFFQAGARTVVASLWPVRDDETEALMAAFYSGLAEGRSVASALAEARRERIRAGAPAAAWAHMVAMGDGEAVMRPPSAPARSRNLPGTLALALGALALGVWVARRRSVR